MTTERPSPPGFWATLWLLLGASRKRAAGRRKRQQELLQQRKSGSTTDWSALGFAVTVLFMAILNGGAAFLVRMAVSAGQKIEVEQRGKIVVSESFLNAAKEQERYSDESTTADGTHCPPSDSESACSATRADQVPLPLDYTSEARDLAERFGGSPPEIEKKLRDATRAHGSRDFITEDDASQGITSLSGSRTLPAMLGSLFLLGWAAMLIFQGEGLELDLQRRRHPMWEWLFSHPVPSGALFLAEMLSPLAANPIYWSAPLFVGFLYGFVYDIAVGLLAAFLIGVPVAVAAACLGKALEIAVILRFPSRSRGAMIGLMSWMGYASMMAFFAGLFLIPKLSVIGHFLSRFTVLPWPWLGWFLGRQAQGTFSFGLGLLTCGIAAGVTIATAIRFSVWGAQKGLSGNVALADSRRAAPRKGGARFGKDPLYRKEFLWFIRDRSAIVQTVLIPLTIAGFQLFNWRSLLVRAESAWNYLCGAGILFGTYFLWILGPKSLASEGTALWIALTWPRGLESLLKAKAWLWSMISNGIVLLVLGGAAYLFPASVWQIMLVGVGWFFFGRSMAEKAVTLVTVTSESGEPQKVHWGRRWASQLGMLTFAIGVLTQQWPTAVVGIVYSYMTAAAMWQNFRARLPYLYDPWSETVPAPPTLMHAMVAISILVEAGAVLMGLILAVAGRESLAIAQTIGYAISAACVSVGMSIFLSDRGVQPRDVWLWEAAPINPEQPAGRIKSKGERTLAFLRLLALGAAGGVILALVASGYTALLRQIPASAELLRRSQEAMSKIPDLQFSYAVMAVAFAPFAEEYLFRGLLYRALDREWGGWRAVFGSAAFFAIYHHPLSWFPVCLVGIANALVFKKTGRLTPCVALHMVYNAVVVARWI